jgi:hypothetical protein
MKKLLALILCVMMFVAIIPTAAFAESISGGVVPSNSGWYDKQVSVQAIKDLKDDMKAMYFAITADQTVFGVAKAYHDLADGLAKNMFDGVDSVKIDGTTIYHDDLVDNVRVFIKQTIGAEIMKELDSNKNGWYDADNGTYDPEKYLKAFSDAATKAVNSAKAQKGLESLVWGLAALKAQKAVNDAGETLYYDMVDWGMDKYDEFGFEDFLEGGQLFLTSKDSTTWSQYAMGSTANGDVAIDAYPALVAMGFAS